MRRCNHLRLVTWCSVSVFWLGCTEGEKSRRDTTAGGGTSASGGTGGATPRVIGDAGSTSVAGGGQNGAAGGAAGEAGASAGSGGLAAYPANGLRGDYFRGAYFIEWAYKQVDALIDFDWGEEHGPDLLGDEKFSMRWTGFVQPTHSEAYTFIVASDDGATLWINGQLVSDHWRVQDLTDWESSPVSLEAGKKYPIQLEYFERDGAASVQLLWESTSESKKLIPNANLFPADMAPVPKFLTFEAEAGVLKNGAQALDCAPCSPLVNGYRVDLTVPVHEDDPPASIELDVIAERGADHVLLVWFANEGEVQTGNLQVNGGTPQPLSFRNNTNTGASSVFEPLEFNVPLNQGTNKVIVFGPTVTASYAADDRVRIDRVTIE